MKKLILLVSGFIVCQCNEPIAYNRGYYTSDGFEVTIIDSCEYIYWTVACGSEYTHKGNCKFCAERRKKEQEELIHRLKEDKQ